MIDKNNNFENVWAYVCTNSYYNGVKFKYL